MRIQTKKDIFDLLQKNRSQMQEYGVEKIGLFGSYLRAESNEKSDVDLLVEFNKSKKTFRNYMGFAFYIENLLGKNVDVITPESLSPYIAPHIKREVEYVQITP